MIRNANANVLTGLLFESLLGTGTMEWIPQWTAKFHTAVWLVLSLYTILLFSTGLIILYISKHISNNECIGCTLFDAFFGRILGWVLNFILVGFLILGASKAFLTGLDLIHYTTLPYTPKIALVLFALSVPLQLLYAGYESLFRFQTVLLVPALFLAVVLLFISLRSADFRNLLPITAPPSLWTVDPLKAVMDLLQGLILFMVYIPLFIQLRVSYQGTMRAVLFAGIGIVLLNALNLLVVLTAFGSFEASTLHYPVLEAVRIQKMTGPLLERLDLVFLMPVSVAVMSAVNLYAYGAYHVLSRYIPSRKRIALIFVVVSMLTFVFIPSNFEFVSDVYESMMRTLEVILVGSLPVMLVKQRLQIVERHVKK
ncbi:GerAB/ArcD/ProY family transporter [Alicyclobacillus ferrooxydans]|uniref:Uncharacterized protein n=1 Tax=Alicyclobacillus ferrooxydans TaxID=471514 RepID=A0A0N8PPB2_9BACL|nr:GerAB/ArcD/ProY family transporter [Alicyclobacillus ferrooxydans]KPV43837.1 hypothetical protein AN477_10725 [Alicyclobacillus ferrooxydans]